MTRKALLLAATALVALPVVARAEMVFSPIGVSTTDEMKRKITTTDTVTINGVSAKIGFSTLARSGDVINGVTFSQLTDQHGNPVKGESEYGSVDADFTSLLPRGDRLFSITHFESRPAAMYISEVKQDDAGNMSFISTKPIDFASVGGLWVPCAGSVTPWGSHLGSEEYPADARAHFEAKELSEIDDYNYAMVAYFGVDPTTMTLAQFRAAYNPYRYGYPIEVTVDNAGNAEPAKHFSMGRVAVELANVMPDQKTAYISDDGTNVGLFRFVADTAGDLTAGQLFAAKWVQTSNVGAGSANIEWVDLGHADDASVHAAIEAGTSFADLFDAQEVAADGSCAEGFHGSNAEGRAECLAVKPGMEMLASRLETRRYASMLGATTEFRKMEGNVYNPDHNSLYLAMSEVSKGMTAGDKLDLGGRDDVRVAKNSCGAVYELSLDANYVATDMKPVVEGKPTDYAEGSEYAGNGCDVDGIANPDNITYIPGQNILLIGEDTGSGHQNDVAWAVDTTTMAMTRIMSTPFGAELTSLDWYPDVNGHAYLMAVVQHPYGESDEDKAESPADTRAYVGYVGPFPTAK
jgi:secreted PhoX family phosphatase